MPAENSVHRLAAPPPEMRTYSTTDEVDAVVIGTGAGGAPVLSRLAQAGMSVVALEAGDWQNPPAHVQDEVEAAPIYWRHERLSAGSDPLAFGANNSGIGVGGSTIHWGAYTPRADPRDLKLHSTTGAGHDWPLSYEDLRPYYEEVERFLGVSGPENYPWDPTRRYPLPPLPLNAPALLMQRGCRELGITTAPAPIAATSRPYQQPGYPLRPACINIGFCHQGCPNTAKAGMDNTYLPLALAHGAEIRANCMAVWLETTHSGRTSAVVYLREGKHIRQRCRAVWLCAGAVETPRLLLRTGLANSSGQVGRNFMAHVSTQAWGRFEKPTHPNRGFPASLITEDTIRPKDADFAGGYLIQSYGIQPVTWAVQTARSKGLWGPELIQYLRQYDHVAGLGVNGECLPSADNFLELSPERDGMGLEKPRIHFSMGPNEKAMTEHAHRTMLAILEASGAEHSWTMNRLAHTIGTCRMGPNADNAVVSASGQSFDIPNLWIADNSVFPSAVPANPGLTIMAVALRSADAFLAERKRG